MILLASTVSSQFIAIAITAVVTGLGGYIASLQKFNLQQRNVLRASLLGIMKGVKEQQTKLIEVKDEINIDTNKAVEKIKTSHRSVMEEYNTYTVFSGQIEGYKVISSIHQMWYDKIKENMKKNHKITDDLFDNCLESLVFCTELIMNAAQLELIVLNKSKMFNSKAVKTQVNQWKKKKEVYLAKVDELIMDSLSERENESPTIDRLNARIMQYQGNSK